MGGEEYCSRVSKDQSVLCAPPPPSAWEGTWGMRMGTLLAGEAPPQLAAQSRCSGSGRQAAVIGRPGVHFQSRRSSPEWGARLLLFVQYLPAPPLPSMPNSFQRDSLRSALLIRSGTGRLKSRPVRGSCLPGAGPVLVIVKSPLWVLDMNPARAQTLFACLQQETEAWGRK